YTSTHDGVMHACGHDVHASVASGMAWVLHQLEAELPTGVRIALQPAEEVVPSGAEAMIRDGAATGVVAGLALHVDPSRELGTVGVRRGALTSATDAFEVRIKGQEGHSARPHLARDAILAAANVTQALYTLVTQRVNPVVPAVLNVGGIRGGVAKNVIAGDCFLDGVVRTLDPDARERLHQEMRKVVEHVAIAHGCQGTIVITTGAPPVMNDPRLNDIVTKSAHEVLGPDNVHPIDVPSTGAEDFGMFGIHMPTYMMRLGVRAPGDQTHHLHTPAFDIDERAIGLALRVMSRAMFRTMHEAKTWG
ncbi:MAG: IAA-amino acid hydrolase, partial [Flavobacteriales bacterium]